jgi:hypothetical protein
LACSGAGSLEHLSKRPRLTIPVMLQLVASNCCRQEHPPARRPRKD